MAEKCLKFTKKVSHLNFDAKHCHRATTVKSVLSTVKTVLATVINVLATVKNIFLNVMLIF